MKLTVDGEHKTAVIPKREEGTPGGWGINAGCGNGANVTFTLARLHHRGTTASTSGGPR